MCGINGVIAFTDIGLASLDRIEAATKCLVNRGPDRQGIFRDGKIALGHTRLSIIDTSEAASQPMHDSSSRYTIIFNGEFFNFKEHREFVLSKGIKLQSDSDTEVLLQLYILEGEKCLERVNGFFAFAIYDKEKQSVFIARDRIGIKPLLYFHDRDKFLFSSELKSLVALGIPKVLDEASLFMYLQLNYIPGPNSIFKGVRKLMPGHSINIDLKKPLPEIEELKYYEIPPAEKEETLKKSIGSYQEQQQKFRELLEASVKRRLVADVPLGTFLSGGIDSSVITSIAAKNTKKLKTFSIGFKDEPLFDETKYAELVANKYNTDHTAFKLTNDDLFQNIFNALDYLDEPFADSSALNVYILSKETRKHVTVALSGDGADELFGGYNKHAAEHKARSGGILNNLLRGTAPFLQSLPQSRNTRRGNMIRKAAKMAEGLQLDPHERYWRWASFENEKKASAFLWNGSIPASVFSEYESRKNFQLRFLRHIHSLQEVLYTDMQLVLVNDMLVKVDMMSMANSLEVRVPFLDHIVVDFAFSLPIQSKIDSTGRKKILRDTFRNDLPAELYNRTKQGFEVPLLKWFRKELRSLIDDGYLGKEFVEEQNIFQYDKIQSLKQKLFGSNPGDAAAQIWALIVFQHWWKKWMS
ncbi:MAG: asparagine synthase (glutamine-hydrolyzing) [Bacteroidetes bacterium]|nr:MAG: asparagine synthase (glutamine-hydrolyzing) [Bacteroidota bacterium]